MNQTLPSGGGGWLTTSRPAARYGSNQQMARPDGRAFLRPLGAEPPRGGALRGASALAPGLGLVAASVWARPCGRASGPGLGPALPTRRPRGLVLLAARQGGKGAPVRALWARPSRPLRPAGRYPCPPWAAWAPPAPPACGGRGYVAAGRRLRRLRSRPCGACQPPAVARGHPSAKQGQAPAGRACGAALLCSSPAPVAASVLRRGPAPTLWGLWGRPRLRPVRAWLRPAAPRWPACGSARAGAALPALGPPGVAAPPRCGVPPPSRGAASAPLRVAARARPQFLRRAQGPCPLCGSRPCPALRARLGRGGTPPAGGTATPANIRQGQDKPPAAGLA